MNHFSLRLLSQPNLSRQSLNCHAPVKFLAPNRLLVFGREVLSFVGADYLQLSVNPLIRRSLMQALQSTSCYSSTPRAQWGTTENHIKAEVRLARFLGTESALLLPSRSQACYSLLSVLLTESDYLLFSDRSESPLRDISELISCKYDLLDLKKVGDQEFARVANSLSLLILDSTDRSLTNVDARALGARLRQISSMVVMDETYALSGAGTRGSGIHEALDFFGDDFCLFGDLSPLFPGSMGFIAGPQVIMEEVRRRSRVLLFERGVTPAVLPAFLDSIDVVELAVEGRILALRNRDVVFSQIQSLLPLASIECPPFPMLQLVFSSARDLEAFSNAMFERGILVEQIAFSGVETRYYFARLFFNAGHKEHDIARLLESLSIVLSR
jgi:7-keto-8-aminopelargonate synthetase-like enzyme